jgi:hypothetical protein
MSSQYAQAIADPYGIHSPQSWRGAAPQASMQPGPQMYGVQHMDQYGMPFAPATARTMPFAPATTRTAIDTARIDTARNDTARSYWDAMAQRDAADRERRARQDELARMKMALHQEITKSRSEAERVQVQARADEGQSVLMRQEFDTLARRKNELEEQYRRMWMAEEARIKRVSEDTRREFDRLRGGVIGALEQMDLANRGAPPHRPARRPTPAALARRAR